MGTQTLHHAEGDQEKIADIARHRRHRDIHDDRDGKTANWQVAISPTKAQRYESAWKCFS
jgi:hypothetical protein